MDAYMIVARNISKPFYVRCKSLPTFSIGYHGISLCPRGDALNIDGLEWSKDALDSQTIKGRKGVTKPPCAVLYFYYGNK